MRSHLDQLEVDLLGVQPPVQKIVTGISGSHRKVVNERMILQS